MEQVVRCLCRQSGGSVNGGTIDASKGEINGWALVVHSNVKTLELGWLQSATLTIGDEGSRGDVASFTATQWDGGEFIAGAVKSLTLKNDRRNANANGDILVEQADLTIGDEAPGSGLRGDAGAISATQWNQGAILAGSIKSLSTKANTRAPGADGDFRADVQLTGSANPAVKQTLGKAKIAGGVIDAFWDILVGDIGSVTAATIDGSTIRAGVEPTLEQQWLPDDVANYTPARSKIGSFTLTGKGQPKGTATFLGSVLAAWELGKVRLGTVDTDASALAFGLAGHTTDAITGATATERLPKSPPFATTEFGDFKLKLVG